jgi:hypothetical protein
MTHPLPNPAQRRSTNIRSGLLLAALALFFFLVVIVKTGVLGS